jgi:hypothetical protein
MLGSMWLLSGYGVVVAAFVVAFGVFVAIALTVIRSACCMRER